MADNQNIKNRLFEYIKYKGISARSFSVGCGFSPNYATNISKGIPEDRMNIISVHYPDLNPAWLMTGEGAMLRADATAQSWEEAEDKEREKEINRLKKELSDLREMVAQLQEDKSNLSDTVKSLSRTLEAISQTSKKS